MIHGNRKNKPSPYRRDLEGRTCAEVLAVYIRKHQAWKDSGRGFPRPPFKLRAGSTVTTARWFDVLAEDCEAHLAYLARKAERPHPRQGNGRDALRQDVIEVLVRARRIERQAAAKTAAGTARR